MRNGAGETEPSPKTVRVSTAAKPSGSMESHTRARKTELLELARQPGRRSKLLERRQAAELRAAVNDVLERAEAWRAPPARRADGPPAPDELLMIVLRHYQRRSENTRRLYARELLLFLAYCESRGQNLYAVRAEHIEDYLALLAGAGLAEASRALALAAIAAYYHRAVHASAIDANPCAIVERPKPAAEEQNQARALSRPQAAELLAAARTRSTLHELLVCLLFFNGLRVSEAASADVEDLSEHQGHRVLRSVAKARPRRTTASPSTPPRSPRSTAGSANGRRSPPTPPRGRCCSPPRPAAHSPGRRSTDSSTASPAQPASASSPPTGSEPRWSRSRSAPACPYATSKTPPDTPTPAPPAATTATDTHSTATPRYASPNSPTPNHDHEPPVPLTGRGRPNKGDR